MLSSITPLGQRNRGMSWIRTVVAFWVGAVFTGSALFASFGIVGEALDFAGRYWLALGALVAAVILDLSGMAPVGPRRQVDEDWLGRYRDWVTGLGFGGQLGLGFATIVPTWFTWALIPVAVVAGWPLAAWVGAGFGIGRSLLLAVTRGVRSTSSLAKLMRQFVDAEPLMKRLALLGLVLVVVVAGLDVS